MMKLYFHPLSGNSRRVLLVATNLDVSLERIAIDLPKGEQKLAPPRPQSERTRPGPR